MLLKQNGVLYAWNLCFNAAELFVFPKDSINVKLRLKQRFLRSVLILAID